MKYVFDFILINNDFFTFLINLMGVEKIGLASAIGLFDGPPEPLGESQNRKVPNSENFFGIN